jgi:glutathione peroxidase
MNRFIALVHAVIIVPVCLAFAAMPARAAEAITAKEKPPMSVAGAYQFSFTSIDGAPMPLSDFAGQVVLVVNTASQCGFTGQYKGLQALYEKYRDRGFTVIGVPCNDFGKQEPGDNAVIKDFARTQYGVTFPLTGKTSVTGDDAHPFFGWAAAQKKGALLQSSPKWNFHKFLLDRQGQVFKSYGSQVAPDDKGLTADIEKLLGGG